MRGKLGKSIVGSGWKGRNYFRSYVVPANPNTLQQQAQRNKNNKAMAEYQTEVSGIADAVTLYNALALARQIAGVNLFMKQALSTVIEATLNGDNVDVDYEVKHDLSQVGLYACVDGATVTELVAKGGLIAGESQYVHTSPAAGEWEYFIGYSDVFAGLDGVDKDAVKCAHWKNNPATGDADPAIVTVPA
jgi:hypothetical protein